LLGLLLLLLNARIAALTRLRQSITKAVTEADLDILVPVYGLAVSSDEAFIDTFVSVDKHRPDPKMFI
jgi:hypothetical protein